MPKTVMSIVGARPQFVKAAAVSRAFAKNENLNEVLIHTGQHFDDNMSEIFFRELNIPAPARNLGVGGGPQGQMTGRMLEGLEEIVLEDQPDALLVYGDTNSTLAGALAAAKLNIPVVHVEAGLRSFNRRMPEEINRLMVDHLSDLLFCPTGLAVENLKNEGVIQNVHLVGDVMYDATLFAKERAMNQSDLLDRLGLREKTYALCTIHRAESTDNEKLFRQMVSYLETVAEDQPIVFPVHPRTRKTLLAYDIELPRSIKLIDPVGYFDIHRLLAGATTVFTDSGGLQKEAYFHEVPCVTMRTETEWVETIEAGWNRLWTSSDFATPRRRISEYGEGQAADDIVSCIDQTLS